MGFLTLRGSGFLALSVAFVDLTTHPDTAYSLQSSCCRSIDTWHEPLPNPVDRKHFAAIRVQSAIVYCGS